MTDDDDEEYVDLDFIEGPTEDDLGDLDWEWVDEDWDIDDDLEDWDGE
jgi:hypothetical protein